MLADEWTVPNLLLGCVGCAAKITKGEIVEKNFSSQTNSILAAQHQNIGGKLCVNMDFYVFPGFTPSNLALVDNFPSDAKIIIILTFFLRGM